MFVLNILSKYMASFRVNKLNKTVVTAALPPEESRLPQSNLDLLYPGKPHMTVYFCYRKPASGSGHSLSGNVVNVLKKALSQTLGPYYAFSGEMVKNVAGIPELLCNNRGVDFEEAFADVELRDLNLYKPDESIQGQLVPVLNDGVLAIQVTQLRCGGLVVGCTFDHRVADAYSIDMFWISWAEMARSKPLSNLPTFSRSLLSPRRPGTFDSSITDLYIPISKLPSSGNESNNSTDQPPSLISRIYSVSADQINLLQQLANHENPNPKRTKLESFTAFLWKLIASGTNTGENSCRLGISIDGRTRIADGALHSYFGNVISHSFGKMKCGELEEMALSSIANAIHNFLDVAVTTEHFLGLIDFVEAHRPELVVYKMLETKVTKEEPALFVSSGRGFPIGKIDFGWGMPVFGSSHCPPGIPTSFVLILPSPSVIGDWVVYMRLSEDQVEVIENGAAHVFKPFCLDR